MAVVIVQNLLSGLSSVRQTGPGKWVACCPAHGDRSPSLAIRDTGDGRILLHCFAGCPTEAVLAALGLKFSDIMPERVKGHAKRERTPFDAKQCLEAVAHEMAAAVLIIENVAGGNVASEALRDRLILAAQRIRKAVDLCGPPPVPEEIKTLRRGEFTA